MNVADDLEVIPEMATCIYVNGIFTGSRVLMRGDPIWPVAPRVLAGEAIHIHPDAKEGQRYVSGQGPGTGG